MIYYFLDSEDDCPEFAQIVDLVRRHTCDSDCFADLMMGWLLQKWSSAMKRIRDKLLLDYYHLSLQERAENVRWAVLRRFNCAFVRTLLSQDGTVTRKSLQESIAVDRSLIHSAALGLGLGLLPKKIPDCRLQSLKQFIIEPHAKPWAHWIEEMVRVCAHEDLNAVADISSTYLPRGPFCYGTPLGIMLTHFCSVLMRSDLRISLWDAAIHTILLEWLSALQAGGVDLLAYGQACPFVFNTDSGEEYGVSGPREYPLRTIRLLDIVYASEPEDWKVLWGVDIEEMARDFWKMIERPVDVMPGAWIDD
jgi:hypothetical protein